MRGPAVRPIVIAAGGTGGHFFPAEALASELIARGHRVVLMTDARSGALQSAVFKDRECHVLKGAGLAGRGVRKAAHGILALAAGTVQARHALRRLNASVVIGFGGYPSVAPVLAAYSLGRARPAIVLHEQNAVLGRANRFLSRKADLLALGFGHTQRVPRQVPVQVVGNPVRPALCDLPVYQAAVAEGEFHLLVMGGSLGARVFSDVVPQAVAQIPQAMRARLRITQQVRAEDMDRVRAAYQDMGVQVDLAPFFTDIAVRLAAAHLVVTRAGASTVAELTMTGRPAILVPLPHAIDDHQTLNARAVAECGGGWLLPQADFTPESLRERLISCLTLPQTLLETAQAARRLAHPQAAADLATALERRMYQDTGA